MAAEKADIIGIDIGTHSSCVAIVRKGLVEVIANENGNRTTPSVVAYLATGEVLVGEEAENQMARNTANTIFDTKTILGQKFTHTDVQDNMKSWPFQMIHQKGMPFYNLKLPSGEKQMTPEEVFSVVINKMKQVAETGLGKKCNKCVIGVPAHFTSNQREAVVSAATSAGLTIQRMVSEPVAVALAHLSSQPQDAAAAKAASKTTRNIVVFDLGGGGLSVTVVSVHDDLMEIKANVRDPHLGGEAFDNLLVEFFMADFRRKFRKEINTNARAMSRLRVASERAKKNLSTMAQAGVELDGLYEGMDFNCNITRARFEDMAYDLIKNTNVSLAKCLEEAKMTKKDIDDVLMVGGGARMPAIQASVSQFFDGKELTKNVNPEESVAVGSAYEAQILSEENFDKPKELQNPVPVNCAPHSLGVALSDGSMGVIIPKNSHIPIKRRVACSTSADNQSAVFLQVYEGSSAVAAENTLLGRFAVTDIPPAPKGEPKINVWLSLNENGVLTVTAEEKSTNNVQKLVVVNKQWNASEGEK